MILHTDDFVIFIVFLLHMYWIPNFLISANLGIAAHSEAGYSVDQVKGYTEQEKLRDMVELFMRINLILCLNMTNS